MCARRWIAVSLTLANLPGALAADGAAPEAAAAPGWKLDYKYPGTNVATPDGRFTAHVELRMQLRYTSEEYTDAPEGEDHGDSDLEVNRFRYKMGGRLYAESLDYYAEYDFPSDRLLDLRFTWTANDALAIRAGQFKVPYNRERIDSSGQQQFVDRSIVNEFFTLDRQQGVAMYGRLWPGTRADSWYNVGVFEGTGRGGYGDADEPLLLGRWQWNLLGRDLKFSQSDVNYRDTPAASLALAAARVRGPYTKFSSAGGGQLDGFTAGDDDRYVIEQAVGETALQYRGWSWQQEIHWKSVEDTESATTTRLRGGYGQVGCFLHGTIPVVPHPLEFAVRYAQVDPDRDRANDTQSETTVAVNWFFSDHDNKLTVDYSWLHDEAAEPSQRRVGRWRAQWDVSF